VQYAREHGLDALVDLVLVKYGSRMDHSPYMDKIPEEVLQSFGQARDERDKQQSTPPAIDGPRH